jgi:hypothetical protein
MFKKRSTLVFQPALQVDKVAPAEQTASEQQFSSNDSNSYSDNADSNCLYGHLQEKKEHLSLVYGKSMRTNKKYSTYRFNPLSSEILVRNQTLVHKKLEREHTRQQAKWTEIKSNLNKQLSQRCLIKK